MIRFIVALIRMAIQFAMSVVKTAADAFEEAWKAAAASIAAIFALPGRLLGGGGGGSAAPLKNLEMALPEPERLGRAEELAKGEAKAIEVINHRLTPAQQVQVFASMPTGDRILADLSALSKEQIDWLNLMSDDQLKVIKEAAESRVAAALAGKPNSLMAIRSVGQPEPIEETAFAHRLAAKRASQITPTHPEILYSLQ